MIQKRNLPQMSQSIPHSLLQTNQEGFFIPKIQKQFLYQLVENQESSIMANINSILQSQVAQLQLELDESKICPTVVLVIGRIGQDIDTFIKAFNKTSLSEKSQGNYVLSKDTCSLQCLQQCGLTFINTIGFDSINYEHEDLIIYTSIYLLAVLKIQSQKWQNANPKTYIVSTCQDYEDLNLLKQIQLIIGAQCQKNMLDVVNSNKSQNMTFTNDEGTVSVMKDFQKASQNIDELFAEFSDIFNMLEGISTKTVKEQLELNVLNYFQKNFCKKSKGEEIEMDATLKNEIIEVPDFENSFMSNYLSEESSNYSSKNMQQKFE